MNMSTRTITAYEKLRKHPRIAVAEPVEIESGANHRTRDEQILELGPGGMFVETDTPEPVGTRVAFCFYPPGHPRVEGEASVVYRASLDGRPGVGMRFVRLTEKSRASLDGFVSARLKALAS